MVLVRELFSIPFLISVSQEHIQNHGSQISHPPLDFEIAPEDEVEADISIEDVFAEFNTPSEGPAGGHQVPEEDITTIGSPEWEASTTWQVKFDRQRLYDLLPYCEALRDAILVDADKLQDLDDLQRLGTLPDDGPMLLHRENLQTNLATHQGPFDEVWPACQQLQADIADRLLMLDLWSIIEH